MAITQTEVDKIAKLAHLAIHQADKPKYIQELSNILDLVEQMNAVDTDNVEPLAHPLEATQRLRADEVTETDQRDYFQKIAPQVEAGLYLVPQVIEEEG